MTVFVRQSSVWGLGVTRHASRTYCVHGWMDGKADRQTDDRQTDDRQKDRLTDGQKDRWMDRQADRKIKPMFFYQHH